MIYLIAIDDLGLCKIGYAKNVRRRIATLQTGCPFAYRLIAEREGDEALERSIHRAAASYRKRGEWFTLCDSVVEAFHSSGMVRTGHSEVVIRIGVDAIAMGLGVSRHTVRSWIQRDSIPADQWITFAAQGWASLDELAEAAARRKPSPQSEAA